MMSNRVSVSVAGCSLLLLLSACTTKTKATLQAQQAYIAGQQQAMAQLQQPGTMVEISGDVENPRVPWRDDLTLAQAIVTAGYRGLRDPQEIIIYRQGQIIAVNPKALLRGEDEPLEPGDRIVLR